VGITCGLSAPYVAGQLDFCMEHLDRFVPVLIGFNPVDAARCSSDISSQYEYLRCSLVKQVNRMESDLHEKIFKKINYKIMMTCSAVAAL